MSRTIGASNNIVNTPRIKNIRSIFDDARFVIYIPNTTNNKGEYMNPIKSYRKMKRINQSEFGALVGRSQSVICQIENGLIPNVELGKKIAKVLRIKYAGSFLDGGE